MKIQVKCFICKKMFDRESREVARNKRNGTKLICQNKECRSTFGRMNNLLRGPQTNKDIAKYCNNRHDEYSQFRVFLHRVKSRKKYVNDITLHDLKELWEKQNGMCSITGIKMKLYNSTNYKSCTLTLDTASLDRIDSNKGYIKGNIQYICYAMNLAKSNFPDSALVEFVKHIREVPGDGLEPPTLKV